MAERDELTSALARTWNKRLSVHGFRRIGRRDLVRISNGIVQKFNFQVSAWGSRDFCVNVAAFTICGNNDPILQPGFRLRDNNGGSMWLASRTPKEAAGSVETAWDAAVSQALPWFESTSSLGGFLDVLRAERWGSEHHLRFQIGVVAAMLAQREAAISELEKASSLYKEDGRSWCAAYVAKCKALTAALRQGNERALLDEWTAENLPVHRLGKP